MNKSAVFIFFNIVCATPLFASILSFPCDLEESQFPHVTIIGTGLDPSSDKVVGNELYSLACAGRAYVASAGFAVNAQSSFDILCSGRKEHRSDALLFGLQSDVASSFIGALNGYFLLVHDLKIGRNEQTILVKKLAFIMTIGESQHNRMVWFRARELARGRFPTFVDVVDGYVLTAGARDSLPQDELLALKDNHAFISNNDAFVEVSKTYAKEMFAQIQREKFLSQQELAELYAFLSDPHSVNLNNQAAKIAIAIQSRAVAQNLMELYCKAKGSGKPVYAIVGQGQVEDLKSLLLSASKGRVRFADKPTGENATSTSQPKSEL